LATYNSCQNANTALKFGIIVGVGASRYLTKMTILWSMNSLKFLQPSMGVRYDCYVQLAAIRARLDVRTEFEILQRLPKGVEADRAQDRSWEQEHLGITFVFRISQAMGASLRGSSTD